LFESAFGVRMVRAEEKIRAVLPTPEAAHWLHVTPATPLLSVERVAYTYNDQAMELRRGLYRTEHHHYRNELQ
jgi:GntR family transcriptional regulator